MTVKLLTERLLEPPSLKGCFTGLSQSALVKMSHCWTSHVEAQMYDHNEVTDLQEDICTFVT